MFIVNYLSVIVDTTEIQVVLNLINPLKLCQPSRDEYYRNVQKPVRIDHTNMMSNSYYCIGIPAIAWTSNDINESDRMNDFRHS